MVAINFQERFAYAVGMGQKNQTIRRKARCKPNDDLQLYTGQRTKRCQKIRDAMCIDVRPVTIDRDTLTVDGAVLFPDSANDFARADGFDHYDQMLEFFERLYGLPFEGVVIEWE